MYAVRYGSNRTVWGCYHTATEACREAHTLSLQGYTATVTTPAGHYFTTYRPNPSFRVRGYVAPAN